ncbi:MAG: fibronectin type III domain-containing protein, partial [Elusimicrobia bacterium]|nr:fibronectin type III domain-containing protein [Elusimicrobiota bacterium]
MRKIINPFALLWLLAASAITALPAVAQPPPPPPPGPTITFEESYVSADISYISSSTLVIITFAVPDSTVYYILDGDLQNSTPTVYNQPFTLPEEGIHDLFTFAKAPLGDTALSTAAIHVDATAPETQLEISNADPRELGGIIYVGTGALVALNAGDIISTGVASGLATTYMLVDIPPEICDGGGQGGGVNGAGSCSNPYYAGQFTLLPGTHTIYYMSKDNVGNEEFMHVASITVQGAASLSGTISITPALPDASTVTVVVSTDYFRSDTGQFFPFAAEGVSLLYSLSLPGPATYYIAAFAGLPGQELLPGTPIGIYGEYSPVFAQPGAELSGLNFSIFPDTIPPVLAVSSPVNNSSISGLDVILGTTRDNTGVDSIYAAVEDLSAGRWWNPDDGIWISTGNALFGNTNPKFWGPPNASTWTIYSGGNNAGVLSMFAQHLAHGNDYRLYLFAKDFVFLQSASVEVNFTWVGEQGEVYPGQVQGFSGQVTATSSVSWDWQPPAGAEGYAVYSDTGVFLSSVTETSFLYSGLEPNSPAAVCVAAYNTYGEGARNCSCALFTLANIPGDPEIVSVSSYSLTVRWAPNGNPAGTRYELNSSTDEFNTIFSTSIVFGSSGDEVVAAITGLEPETTCYAKVRALNGDYIPTEYSSVVSTKTLEAYPTPPVYPAAFVMDGGKVMFSWRIPSGQLPYLYNVYCSSVAGELVEGDIPNSLLQISSNNTTTSIIDSPASSGLYYYAVTALNRLGQESQLSEVVPLLVDFSAPSAEIIFSSPAVSRGIGIHPFRLVISELLAFPPILTITPRSQSPILLRLEAESPTIWKGTFTITQQTNSGEAAFTFSGEDLAGNTGTLIWSGGTVGVDTEGPYGYVTLSAVSISHGELDVSLRTNEQTVSTPTLMLRNFNVPHAKAQRRKKTDACPLFFASFAALRETRQACSYILR